MAQDVSVRWRVEESVVNYEPSVIKCRVYTSLQVVPLYADT